MVPDGILNRALSEISGGISGALNGAGDKNEQAAQSMHFVYPFGSTLNVQKPSVPVLSSGTVCYPIKRPLCALFGSNALPGGAKKIGGKIEFFHFLFNLKNFLIVNKYKKIII